nr:T669 kinase - human [Homo sapiens]
AVFPSIVGRPRLDLAGRDLTDY